MDRDYLPQKQTPGFIGLDPPHIARLKQQVNHNPLLLPQSITQIAGRKPLPPSLDLFGQQEGEMISDVSRLRTYVKQSERELEEAQVSPKQKTIGQDEKEQSQRMIQSQSAEDSQIGSPTNKTPNRQVNTSMDLNNNNHDDFVFNQILEHIINQNDSISQNKKFRRFRLQRAKDEKNDLDEEEKSKGMFAGVQKGWQAFKERVYKIMPSSVRKLWKLEKQSSNSAENAYRIVKETDILRLKLKIVDFLAAVMGAGHGWLMFTEKTVFEDPKHRDGNLSTTLRIFGILVTAILIFSIIKHYQYQFQMRKIENYGVYYPSIWKDTSNRAILILELFICSITMPPFLDSPKKPLKLTLQLNGVEVTYFIDMIVSTLSMLKSYTILRLYEHISKWTDYDAKKTSLPFGLETDFKFAFKSDVRSNNLKVFLLSGLVLVAYFAVIVFNLELYYTEPRLVGTLWEQFFKQFQNALWLELTTVTGVGVGDGYPASIPARFVHIFSCMTALLSLSIVIKIVYGQLALTPKEASAYHLVHQDVHLRNNQLQARNVIIEALKLRQLSKQQYKSRLALDMQKSEFFSAINDFQLTHQAYTYQVLSVNRYINQILDRMKASLAKTKEEFERIPEVLDKMKKFRERKRESNMKIQYLTFIQHRVFDFLAARGNGYLKEIGGIPRPPNITVPKKQ